MTATAAMTQIVTRSPKRGSGPQRSAGGPFVKGDAWSARPDLAEQEQHGEHDDDDDENGPEHGVLRCVGDSSATRPTLISTLGHDGDDPG